jgi:competence protein ComEC
MPALWMPVMAAGIAVVALLPRLPPWWLMPLLVLMTAIVAWRLPRVRYWLPLPAALLVGLAWGIGFGHYLLAGLLPPELEREPLWLEGRVVGLVEPREYYGRPALRFELAVAHCALADGSPCATAPRRALLNWYDINTDTPPTTGERWRLQVRLKRPHGFANPGGFDYGAWQVAQGLGATGNIVRRAANQRLQEAGSGPRTWRAQLHAHLDERLWRHSQQALMVALLVGDDNGISREQWATFRATGTVHLFVVSGLHIALTGGAMLLLVRSGGRLPLAASRRRGRWLAAALALPAATLYALLAGFDLPVQRALIMFSVAALAWAGGRSVRPLSVLLLALWLVLLCDPLAVMNAGFWFSFGVVATLFAVASGRRGDDSSGIGRPLREGLLAQWAVTVATVPILLGIGAQFPLTSLLANAVAIPVTTLLTLPLLGIGLLFDLLRLPGADLGWQLANLSLQWLWEFLQWLAGVGARWQWHPAGIDGFALLLATAAALLWLLPRGVPGRWLALPLLLPLLWPPSQLPPPGSWRVTVVDVGQGLSVLVEEGARRLLYDTGPSFPSGSTAAELTLLPLLQRRGIDRLDTLVISHDDSDHAGGWPTLRNALPIDRLLAGEPRDEDAEACRDGLQWHWQRLTFRVLHPVHDRPAGNHASCVLLVDDGITSLLLPGDIDRLAEGRLLAEHDLAPTTLVVAPHHGGRSSSSPRFVRALAPRYAIFSAGYRSHFGHPHPEVVERYRSTGARLLNTASSGALTFTIGAAGAIDLSEYRRERRRYWEPF